MSDLHQSLIEALDARDWEDVTGAAVVQLYDAAEQALTVFAAWLREQARETQTVADALTEPTARTIALVRVDTITRLADEVDLGEQT